MVSKTVPIGTDGVKEPSINSTRNLYVIAADQAGVMNIIIDAGLKQNSNLFVHDIQLSTSTSREFLWETQSVNHHGQGERTWLFPCPGDSNITECVYTNSHCLHVKMCYFQHLLWKVSIPIKDRERLFASIMISGCRLHNKTSNRKHGASPSLFGLETQIFQQALNYTTRQSQA